MLYVIFMYSLWMHGDVLEVIFVPFIFVPLLKENPGKCFRTPVGKMLISPAWVLALLESLPAPLERVGVLGVLKKLLLDGYC